MRILANPVWFFLAARCRAADDKRCAFAKDKLAFAKSEEALGPILTVEKRTEVWVTYSDYFRSRAAIYRQRPPDCDAHEMSGSFHEIANMFRHMADETASRARRSITPP